MAIAWNQARFVTGAGTDITGEVVANNITLAGNRLLNKLTVFLSDDSVNDNGLFDESGNYSGLKTDVGITPRPATLTSNDPEKRCEYLIFPGTSGGTQTECRDPGPRGYGRQSWRQAH